MGKVEDTFEEILDDDSEEQFWESNYYWGAARFQIEVENFGRALKLIDKALKINKSDTDFVSTKAEILFEQENFKDALKWIKKCEKMEEKIGEREAGTFMLMANIYHDTRKFALSTKALLDELLQPNELHLHLIELLRHEAAQYLTFFFLEVEGVHAVSLVWSSTTPPQLC